MYIGSNYKKKMHLLTGNFRKFSFLLKEKTVFLLTGKTFGRARVTEGKPRGVRRKEKRTNAKDSMIATCDFPFVF